MAAEWTRLEAVGMETNTVTVSESCCANREPRLGEGRKPRGVYHFPGSQRGKLSSPISNGIFRRAKGQAPF